MSREMLRRAFVGWQLAIAEEMFNKNTDSTDLVPHLRAQAKVYTSYLKVTQEALDAVEKWFNWEEIKKQMADSSTL